MKEFDVVKLKCDFQGITAGTEGAIVLEYDGTAFEVEFFDKEGNTVCVATTLADIIQLVSEYKPI